MKRGVKKYVYQFPVSLPGGNFCVVAAEVPMSATNIYDDHGGILRRYWVFKKLFKRKSNADRCLQKIYDQQRSHNLTQIMINKGLINLN